MRFILVAAGAGQESIMDMVDPLALVAFLVVTMAGLWVKASDTLEWSQHCLCVCHINKYRVRHIDVGGVKDVVVRRVIDDTIAGVRDIAVGGVKDIIKGGVKDVAGGGVEDVRVGAVIMLLSVESKKLP